MKISVVHLLIIVIILCLGLIATYFSFTFNEALLNKEIQGRFKEGANLRINAIKQNLKVNLKVLQAVKAFYDGSNKVTPKEFQTFTDRLMSDNKSIRFLLRAPKITDETELRMKRNYI